jgi:iron complex outermembrane receptor protein
MQGHPTMRKLISPAFAVSTIAIVAASIATPAFAQSTGAVEFEQVIVVTGQANKSLGGVSLPETPKAKQVLDAEFIGKSSPGQSINDVINMIPGVSFFNADPFGSSGGTMYIRGFDSSRISQTFDGMPLNDTGNYALYSNQQLDPELISQVNVNLGSTDVDSPTAAATGSTVNYRSRDPYAKPAVNVIASGGDYSFRRLFGVVDTGVLTSSGLSAWFSGSTEYNRFIADTGGRVFKQQLNFKVKQPIGDNGDFVSIAGHFNNNRNNFAPSIPLVNQNVGTKVVNSSSSARYPTSWDDAQYSINCADTTSANKSITGYGAFECRYNPSRTANLRLNSRFTLADNLVLTIDPSFQYTKANGGGVSTLSETANANGLVGFVGGGYYAGYDVNSNGTVNTGTSAILIGNASETETNRIGLLASMRWKINPTNTIRVAYSYDRGRHKQTGEITPIDLTTGYYTAYFPIDNLIKDKYGNPIEKRNRMSYAILNKVSAEYNGKFFDNKLDVLAGIAAPFFKRNLTNFCYTTDAGGTVACPAPQDATAFGALTTSATYAAPQQRTYNYNRVLPNIGFTYKILPEGSFFANYSKGIQVPGTDTLYNAFYYAQSSNFGNPRPETTDNFDAGLRYRHGRLSASFAGWYTMFYDKISQVYNQDAQASVYTNLGKVEKYGIDATVSFKADEHFSVYAFGSWNKSRILNDINAGKGATGTTAADGTVLTRSDGTFTYYPTAGKRESGVPLYTAGARIEANFDPFDLTVSVKNTGKRYINALNTPVYTSAGVMQANAAAGAYTTVDLAARMKLAIGGLDKGKSYVQLNVVNLFNQFYVGGFSGAVGATSVVNTYLPVPRTVTATLSVGF